MKAGLSKRRLIPRWRRISATLALKEGRAFSRHEAQPITLGLEDFELAVGLWSENPTIGHLGDVLSFSIAADCLERVRHLAGQALKQEVEMTAPQKAIMLGLVGGDIDADIQSVDEGICNPHVRTRVHELRELLKINPANPLALLDFAQLQLVTGNVSRADRSLRSALSLSPNSRVVLRTLSRFYAHVNKPDQAQDLLAAHARTRVDPWLMASEIAMSQVAGRTSRFVNAGTRLVKEGIVSPADRAELAGALAGLELSHGNVKRARYLFRMALVEPNDNVVAQAIHDRKYLGLDLSQPGQKSVVQSTAEARALLDWDAVRLDAALANGMLWHGEEPFSSRPLQFVTSALSATARYEEAERYARRGIIADPKDASLLSNLAYALACLGQLDEAERISLRALSSESNDVKGQILATTGLIAMKRGDFTRGDELYSRAIEYFERKKQRALSSICRAYYARSSIDTGHPDAKKVLSEALQSYDSQRTTDAAVVLTKLHAEVELPQQEAPVRRLSQWVFDRDKLVLYKKDGLTEPGAPALIIRDKK